MKSLKKLWEDRRGASILGIITVVVVIGVGSVIGLTLIAKSKEVFDNMALAAAANTAMDNTVATLYSSWPLLGLVALAMIGAAAIAAFMIIRS